MNRLLELVLLGHSSDDNTHRLDSSSSEVPLLRALSLNTVQDLNQKRHEGVEVIGEFVFNKKSRGVEGVQDGLLEWLVTSINGLGQVVDEGLKQTSIVISDDFRALFSVLDLKIILLNQTLHKVSKAVNSLSSDLKRLLSRNDLQQSWHKFSVELKLNVWSQVLEELGKSKQSSVLDSHMVSRKALANLLHGLVHVILEVVLARLDNQTEGDETSLSGFPVIKAHALLNKARRSSKSVLLLKLSRKAGDGRNGSGVSITLGASLIVKGGFPSLGIVLTFCKKLDESRPEGSLNLVDLSQNGGHSFGQIKDDLAGLRFG